MQKVYFRMLNSFIDFEKCRRNPWKHPPSGMRDSCEKLRILLRWVSSISDEVLFWWILSISAGPRGPLHSPWSTGPWLIPTSRLSLLPPIAKSNRLMQVTDGITKDKSSPLSTGRETTGIWPDGRGPSGDAELRPAATRTSAEWRRSVFFGTAREAASTSPLEAAGRREADTFVFAE